MVFTKESDFYKVIKGLINEESKTGEINTEPLTITFISGEGIVLAFSKYNIKISNKDVYFSGVVRSPLFLVFFASAVSEKEKAEIDVKNSSIYVNEFKFPIENTDEVIKVREERKYFAKFSPEQFAKLERDFKFSISNSFQDPTLTDVIQFGIKDGELFEIAPGCYGDKFGKFDALVDDVEIQQRLGHDKTIWTLPHSIYNIINSFGKSVEFYIDNRLRLRTENVEFSLDTLRGKFGLFENRVKWFSEFNSGVKVSAFEKAKFVFKTLAEYNFKSAEDIEAFLSIDDNGNLVIDTIDGVKFKFETDEKKNFKIGINSTRAFYEIISQVSDDAIIGKLENVSDRIFIKDKNSLFSICDSDIEE